MDILGLIHISFATSSLLFGGLVVARQKGTFTHKINGRLYVLSMVGLNGTAFLIYDLFGYFGPFHYLALASLTTIVAGMIPVIRKRPKKSWLYQHAYIMSWSYAGLLAAGATEITTRLLNFSFGWTVFVSSTIALAISGLILHKRVAADIQNMGISSS